MYYARNQQGPDLRGGVTADTAWELCCRTLSEPVDIRSLSSRALAQLLIYHEFYYSTKQRRANVN